MKPRFDPRALRSLAGETTFARGEAYHCSGQVTILSIDRLRVLAQVSGTDDYRVELSGTGTRFGGECSCPAFEDSDFCKHMVATALAANAAGEGADTIGGIRAYLESRGTDALVAMILELAERDPALLRRLDLAAGATGGDPRAVEARFRKAIDAATRTRGFIDYREARDWAANVEETLDSLAELASGPAAGVALRLAGHALARIERAVESIDDSDGHGADLLEQVRDIHVVACRTVRPDPVALARDLFARETGAAFDTFLDAAKLYGEVLGEPGLAEYRRLAAEAWERLPALSPTSRTKTESFGIYSTLRRILDRFAERDGDVAARIELRTKDLSAPWCYRELAEFCLAQGRPDEALRRAEEGLWVFEDDPPDERLIRLAVDLCLKAGRRCDAEACLWRAFEKRPGVDLYQSLKAVGGDEARDRALALLEARLRAAKPAPWTSPADLIVRVLIAERRYDRAWEIVRERGVSDGLAETLARATEANHPRDALAVYADRVRALVDRGGAPNYEEAVALIARMAPLREPAGHAAYVADLRLRLGRKRNFIKLLA